MGPHISPFAYADNWSWLTDDQRPHAAAHAEVFRFTQSLRLQIDHGKSWHWGTTKEFRKFCDDAFTEVDGKAVVKSVVKDLGEIVHYYTTNLFPWVTSRRKFRKQLSGRIELSIFHAVYRGRH